jgi:hypothetical protein
MSRPYRDQAHYTWAARPAPLKRLIGRVYSQTKAWNHLRHALALSAAPESQLDEGRATLLPTQVRMGPRSTSRSGWALRIRWVGSLVRVVTTACGLYTSSQPRPGLWPPQP